MCLSYKYIVPVLLFVCWLIYIRMVETMTSLHSKNIILLYILKTHIGFYTHKDSAVVLSNLLYASVIFDNFRGILDQTIYSIYWGGLFLLYFNYMTVSYTTRFTCVFH